MRRKLDIGRVLSEVFQTFGNEFGRLLPAAVVIALLAAVLDALANEIFNGGLLSAAFRAVIDLTASMLFAGLVVTIVARLRTGERRVTWGAMLRRVSPVLLTLVAAGFLYGVGVTIGFFLLVVPGLILLTWWALLAPVIVVERTGVFAAFGRSRRLVEGNGWMVFGVVVVIFVLTALISLLLVVLFDIIGGFAGSLVGIFIAGLITKPIAALAAPIMYFDLRDIEREAAGAEPADAVIPSRS